MADSLITQISRAFLCALADALTFPWWWYTRGLRRVLRWAGRTLRGWERAVGLRLWLKSLFVPMFGQTDWQGRIVSFSMRFAVLFGRMCQVAFGGIVMLLSILAYLALPPFVLWQIVLAALS